MSPKIADHCTVRFRGRKVENLSRPTTESSLPEGFTETFHSTNHMKVLIKRSLSKWYKARLEQTEHTDQKISTVIQSIRLPEPGQPPFGRNRQDELNVLGQESYGHRQ